MKDIFYPNDLKLEEVEQLSGWKLKIAVMHFGIGRDDCVRFGYGYKMMKSNIFADKETIHLVADEDGIQAPLIDLGDEIDWDDPASLIAECGVKIPKLYKDRVKEQLTEWFVEA